MYNTQSYNRYSYVRNNPLKYTDPSGHWGLGSIFHAVSHAVRSVVHAVSHAVSSAINFIRTHSTQILTAAIIVASGGLALGAVNVMGLGGTLGGAIAGGAIAGFVSGVGIAKLNGASWSQAFGAGIKGAVYGAVGGGMAYGIGGYFGHDASFFNSGSSFTDAIEKAVAHGVSRAALAYARGEKVSSAFWSGFVASGFAAPKSMGFYKGTMIMAVASGTTSRLTGGKFANGAVTGAFVHMFNAMYDVMNSNLPRAMSSSGKAGISDRQAFQNGQIATGIAASAFAPFLAADGTIAAVSYYGRMALTVSAEYITNAYYITSTWIGANYEKVVDFIDGAISPNPPTNFVQIIANRAKAWIYDPIVEKK